MCEKCNNRGYVGYDRKGHIIHCKSCTKGEVMENEVKKVLLRKHFRK